MDAIKDGAATRLGVLNYASKKSREVVVVPNRSWGGDGLLGNTSHTATPRHALDLSALIDRIDDSF